jgi:arylsulfatase A-like enzyme
MMLLNFAPEAQCTPSRSALMTGRYSIRSGNHTVVLAGSHGGLVRWERTLGDIFSDAGYATAIVGKWHIGDSPGRFITGERRMPNDRQAEGNMNLWHIFHFRTVIRERTPANRY